MIFSLLKVPFCRNTQSCCFAKVGKIHLNHTFGYPFFIKFRLRENICQGRLDARGQKKDKYPYFRHHFILFSCADGCYHSSSKNETTTKNYKFSKLRLYNSSSQHSSTHYNLQSAPKPSISIERNLSTANIPNNKIMCIFAELIG